MGGGCAVSCAQQVHAGEIQCGSPWPLAFCPSTWLHGAASKITSAVFAPPEQNMRPHLRTTNAKVKELMDNSNSKCVAELQSKFRKLLADEIRKIESLEDMPMVVMVFFIGRPQTPEVHRLRNRPAIHIELICRGLRTPEAVNPVRLVIHSQSCRCLQETKKLLRKHIKSLIMRRVEVEVEKKKLFEWPEEAVKKYANDHIKAEIERR